MKKPLRGKQAVQEELLRVDMEIAQNNMEFISDYGHDFLEPEFVNEELNKLSEEFNCISRGFRRLNRRESNA